MLPLEYSLVNPLLEVFMAVYGDIYICSFS